MVNKPVFILSILGTILYFITIRFVNFVLNYPEGGFSISLKTTYAIYISYLILMFSSLIIGTMLLFRYKSDNSISNTI